MGLLNGKAAVVTGASKGIGAGIAMGLAEAGAAVAVKGDVSRAADVRLLFEKTVNAFGALDVLEL
jgi:3-oxoacyl-[acyl-carrier protein] reductase